MDTGEETGGKFRLQPIPFDADQGDDIKIPAISVSQKDGEWMKAKAGAGAVAFMSVAHLLPPPFPYRLDLPIQQQVLGRPP